MTRLRFLDKAPTRYDLETLALCAVACSALIGIALTFLWSRG